MLQLKKELRSQRHIGGVLDELISFGEELAPQDAELKLIEASALRTQGNVERAKLALEEALRIAPSYSPAVTAYGELLIESGFLFEGRDYCLSALRLNPIDMKARSCAKK